METYNEDLAKIKLEQLNNWIFVNHGIEKKFVFKNFNEALGFIVQVGVLAEKANHHPTFKNTYNVVEIWLTTHDAGNTITEKDTALAKQIDKI